MMQTLTHKLKYNTIQILCKTNKHKMNSSSCAVSIDVGDYAFESLHKMNNLIKYTTQEHTGYVTCHTGKVAHASRAEGLRVESSSS